MPTNFRKLCTLALTVVAFVSTAGCGGSSDTTVTTPTGSSGSFSATITGGAAGTYNGFAGAAVAGGFVVISLGTTDTKFALAFTKSGARPAPGTYTLTDNLLTNFVAALNINNGGALYGGTSGTLTITAASATEIRGSFTFAGKLNNGTTTNSVTGNFVAPCQLGC